MAADTYSERIMQLWELTEELYSQSMRPETKYLWNNHVQVVAHNAGKLSERYSGDKDLAIAGALLHDIADIWLERSDERFEATSKKTASDLLRAAGFFEDEIIFINHRVIAPHPCHPENFPTTLEGKIMATADALAHLNTNFYREIYPIFFKNKKTESEYRKWVVGKLNRDFNTKIFFEEVKVESKQFYEQLISEFN